MNNSLKFFSLFFFLMCILVSSLGVVFAHDDPSDPGHAHNYPSVVTTEDTRSSNLDSNKDSNSANDNSKSSIANSNNNPDSNNNPNGQNPTNGSKQNSSNETNNTNNMTNNTNFEDTAFPMTPVLITVIIILAVSGIIIFRYFWK